MKNNKVTLLSIIILLCLFLPLTIIGFIFKDDRNLLDENPKHDLYYKDKIWFYDKDDKFIGSYDCQTEICELASPTINDDIYNIKYYKGDLNVVSMIDESYAFITDGSVINLYDIKLGAVLESYNSLKNYNTLVENNTYIIQKKDGLWGALTIDSNLGPVLPFNYDYIALTNNTENDVLQADKFIVLKDSKWYIVDNNNSAISGYIEDPIVEYTDNYIFSRNSEQVRIYSFQNTEYLTNYKIKDYVVFDNYIGVVLENSLLIYNDLSANFIKNIIIENSKVDIKLEKENSKLIVKINNEPVESIELN